MFLNTYYFFIFDAILMKYYDVVQSVCSLFTYYNMLSSHRDASCFAPPEKLAPYEKPIKTKLYPGNPSVSLQECGLQTSADLHKSIGPEKHNRK